MVTFIEDEASYLAWIVANPKGFVLNVPRSGTSVPIVLHLAHCIHIRTPKRANYTTSDYYKICAFDSEVLLLWSQSHGQLRICAYCQPLVRRDNSSVVQQGCASDRHLPTMPVETHDLTDDMSVTSISSIVQDFSHWSLWEPGERLKVVTGLQPRLASWEANVHPEQMALQAYLEDVIAALMPMPRATHGLYLHMTIDLEKPQRLLQGNDLENYLTPLFSAKRLDPALFRLVSATKCIGGGSYLEIGAVVPRKENAVIDGWGNFACQSHISDTKVAWKSDLRLQLARSCPHPLPNGPAEVQLAWRCNADRGRRWVDWWKATGDARGPVLGEPDPKNPFNPADDRVVLLQLHLVTDEAMQKEVDIGMWWRRYAPQASEHIDGRQPDAQGTDVAIFISRARGVLVEPSRS